MITKLDHTETGTARKHRPPINQHAHPTSQTHQTHFVQFGANGSSCVVNDCKLLLCSRPIQHWSFYSYSIYFTAGSVAPAAPKKGSRPLAAVRDRLTVLFMKHRQDRKRNTYNLCWLWALSGWLGPRPQHRKFRLAPVRKACPTAAGA